MSAMRPGKDDLARATGRTIPDVLGPGLRLVFCGINPGLWSGATGHHFARPGNRFWKALHGAGFTDRVLSPFEDATLLERGIGITNLVARTTAAAAELSAQELRAGAAALERMVHRLRPARVAVLGIGAYRTAFDRPSAVVGPQAERVGETGLWVLPNPSGLNAHYQLDALVEAFRDLRQATLGEVSRDPSAPGAEPTPGSARPSRRARRS